eukprot:2516114-Alexandrium_andersonii.AAC.1
MQPSQARDNRLKLKLPLGACAFVGGPGYGSKGPCNGGLGLPPLPMPSSGKPSVRAKAPRAS